MINRRFMLFLLCVAVACFGLGSGVVLSDPIIVASLAVGAVEG